MLEDGEILIDSTAILDYLNELTPDAPLIPSASKPRRQAQKLAAIGLGMFEQTTKLSFRGADLTPAEAERWWGQIRGGLEALDAAAGEAGPLWVTPIDVAVITAVLAVEDLGQTQPTFDVAKVAPALTAVAVAYRDTPPFALTRPA